MRATWEKGPAGSHILATHLFHLAIDLEHQSLRTLACPIQWHQLSVNGNAESSLQPGFQQCYDEYVQLSSYGCHDGCYGRRWRCRRRYFRFNRKWLKLVKRRWGNFERRRFGFELKQCHQSNVGIAKASWTFAKAIFARDDTPWNFGPILGQKIIIWCFLTEKTQKIRKKKQEFAALFFPLALLLLLLLLKKKLDERSKMKEKKIQIIHYLKFERIFVRPEKKRKTKTTAICLHNWKKKYYEEAKCGEWLGLALDFAGCHALAPPLT